MLKFVFRSTLLYIILITSACLSVSEQELVLSSSADLRTDTTHCPTKPKLTKLDKSVKATGFTLVSWNIYKQNKTGWAEDLLILNNSSDFILLQEAYLTPELENFLETSDKNWDMVSAFRYQSVHSGVMTIASVPVQAICAQQINEPLLRLPKTSLITYYPINNTQDSLLVANIHAINFTLNTKRFSEQLLHLKEVLARHTGPIVFAGDFNTWSDQREIVLNQLIGAEELGLHKVEFTSNKAMLAWGHRLDHIFFRGLKIVKAEIIPVESSDHYPLKVQFEFIPENHSE